MFGGVQEFAGEEEGVGGESRGCGYGGECAFRFMTPGDSERRSFPSFLRVSSVLLLRSYDQSLSFLALFLNGSVLPTDLPSPL